MTICIYRGFGLSSFKLGYIIIINNSNNSNTLVYFKCTTIDYYLFSHKLSSLILPVSQVIIATRLAVVY